MSFAKAIDSPFRSPAAVTSPKVADDEFINGIRRGLETMVKWRAYLIGFYTFLIAIWFLLATQMYRIAEAFAPLVPAAASTTPSSFAIGIMLGAKVGMWMFFCGFNLLLIVKGDRKSRLLVEYHDRLKLAESTLGQNEQLSRR